MACTKSRFHFDAPRFHSAALARVIAVNWNRRSGPALSVMRHTYPTAVPRTALRDIGRHLRAVYGDPSAEFPKELRERLEYLDHRGQYDRKPPPAVTRLHSNHR